MRSMASQITSLTIVYSTVYSGADQNKHPNSSSLASMRGIHRWPANSPHKGPVTRKMFPFYYVNMTQYSFIGYDSAIGFLIALDAIFSRQVDLVDSSATSWSFSWPHCRGPRTSDTTRADSRFAPSQWETALLCSDVFHWLGASLESALRNTYKYWTGKNTGKHTLLEIGKHDICIRGRGSISVTNMHLMISLVLEVKKIRNSTQIILSEASNFRQ